MTTPTNGVTAMTEYQSAEVWRVASRITPLREFDTKAEALAWSDHLVACGEAPAAWPVLIEVSA